MRDSSLLVERSVPVSPRPPAQFVRTRLYFFAPPLTVDTTNTQDNSENRLKKEELGELRREGGGITWQRDALDLVGLAGVSLELAFGYRLGFPQVEEREPVAHRRLLGFSRRPFVATTHESNTYFQLSTEHNMQLTRLNVFVKK